MRRLAKAARPQNGKAERRRPHTDANVPDRRRLYSDMAVLLRQDLANVESGIYPLPADHDGSLLKLLQRSGQLDLLGVDVAEAYGGLELNKVTSMI